MTGSGNLFANVPEHRDSEEFTELLRTGGVKIERIVSTGQTTADGEWLVQAQVEWVVVLAGAARLRFAEGVADIALGPGNWLEIPAGARHRVAWTDPAQPTVWLAVHAI